MERASGIYSAPHTSTGLPVLPATAVAERAERSLTPHSSSLRAPSSPLEVVLQDPQHPDAVTVLIQELMQQRREMRAVVDAGQDLQGRVRGLEKESTQQQREMDSVVQSSQQLQRRILAHEKKIEDQKNEISALRKDQKKQAYTRVADQMIRDFESSSNEVLVVGYGTYAGSFIAGLAFSALTGGAFLPFALVWGAGIIGSGVSVDTAQKFKKAIWIYKTFPEVVKHREIAIQANAIFDIYNVLYWKFTSHSKDFQQRNQNILEALEKMSQKLKITNGKNILVFEFVKEASLWTDDNEEALETIKNQLGELQGKIERLERAVAAVYEDPVLLTEDEFKDQLAPPGEFYEGRRLMQQRQVEQAVGLFQSAQKKSIRWAPHCQVGIIYCLIKMGQIIEAKKLIDDFNNSFPTKDESVNLDILALKGTLFLYQKKYDEADHCFQETRSTCRVVPHLIDIAGRLLDLNPLHPFALEVLYKDSPKPLTGELLRKLFESFSASSEKFPECGTLLRNLIYLHLDLLRFESNPTLKKERLKIVGQLVNQAAKSSTSSLSVFQFYLLLSEAWLRVIFDCGIGVDGFEEFLSYSEGHNSQLFSMATNQENYRSLARGQRMFIFLLRALTFQGHMNKKKDFTDSILAVAGEMTRFDLDRESLYSPSFEDSEMKMAPRKLNEILTASIINLVSSVDFLDKQPLYSFLQFLVRIPVADARLFSLLGKYLII